MFGYRVNKLPTLNSRERNQIRNEGHSMKFTLSKNVKAGNKIKTNNGWRVVKEVNYDGIIVKEGHIKFGSEVFGWKSS